jgi:hypothetical protein
MIKNSSLRGVNRAARLAAVTAVLLVCSVAAFGTPDKPKKVPPPDDLPTQVNKVARQLWGVPLDESEPLTSQVEKLVLDHMTQWINAHPPDADPKERADNVPYNTELRHEVESLFENLRHPIYATASTFSRSLGDKPVVGVGYTLGWSDFDRANVLSLYEAINGSYQPVTVTHFVPHTDLSYRFLQPPAGNSDQLWFLAYGTRLGKSNPRLSAILYSFDGKTLQPLWRTTDVYGGKISFRGNRVVIDYLKEDELTQAIIRHTPAVHHEAAYQLTPKGLELESDR